jgi:spore coat protein U-like protein
MKNSIRYSVLALATAALAFSTGAFAQRTAVGDLAVSAHVSSECFISNGGAIAFPIYRPITNKSAGLNGTGSVSYTCSENTLSAIITLGQGLHPDAVTTTDPAPARQMAHGSDMLAYTLWSDNQYGVPWGNTPDSGVALVAGTLDGSEHSVTVYGTITQAQNVPDADYADTVIVTITYV